MANYNVLPVILLYLTCGVLGDVKNVLFVVVDDLRHVSYYDSQVRTPNIEELSKNSAVFTNAYSQIALCAPSRNSFLTSRQPDSLHLYDFYSYWRNFTGNFTTLPQYLKDSGYETYSVGKVFHEGEASNFTDDWPYSWSEPAWHPPSNIHKDSPVCFSERGWNADLVCPVDVKEQPGKTLPDIESTDQAIHFLNNRNKTKPFFLAVGYHKPHVPLKFPKEYLDMYPLETISLPDVRLKPKNMPDVAWNPYNDLRQRDDMQLLNISFPYGPIEDTWVKRIRQAYYASVTYMDGLFGKILTALKANNFDENTVIVFLSDHGWSLGEHGEWAKFSNFDVAVRVPVIIRIPGLTNGTKIPDIIQLIDVFPTLADILQLPPVPSCSKTEKRDLCTEGKSAWPLIMGQTGLNEERHAFSQYPRPGLLPTKKPNSDRPILEEIKYMGYSVRTEKHRYTVWPAWQPFSANWSQIAATELYDHTTDPNENNNIADLSENSQIIDYLHKILLQHFER